MITDGELSRSTSPNHELLDNPTSLDCQVNELHPSTMIKSN